MVRKLEPEEIAFIHRIDAVVLRKEDLPFEEVVRRYREIEVEFVERSRDEQYKVVETRRRITEWLLQEAHGMEQPLEVCTAIWEELVERGFSDYEQKSVMTGIYARCCQQIGAFDAGIAVMEPLIAETEQWLAHGTFTPELRAYWEHTVEVDYKIVAELKAGIRDKDD